MKNPDGDPAQSGGLASSDTVDPELCDEWAALHAAEQAAIVLRRQRVRGDAKADASDLRLPQVGLALSGGGVRSATFALGLMRALARPQTLPGAAPGAIRPSFSANGLLGRLDYLSTVSGGGYTGGMYGRLVATYGLRCALVLMASGESPVLEWLRRNGRYLTPSGSRDIGIAVVTYLRSWLAIHAEFMFASLFVGLLVLAPHLWNHSVQALDPRGWERWHTVWWPLALGVWAALAPGLVAGYWAARDAPDPSVMRSSSGWRDLLFLLVSVIATYTLTRSLHAGGALQPARFGLNWALAAVLALASITAGQLAVWLWMTFRREPHALKVARLRNWLTRALRAVLLIALALAGLGALDRLSWWVLEELQSGNRWLWGGAGVGGVALLLLRASMQTLQQIATRSDHRARDWLPRLLDLGSLFGLLVLITAWLVLIQWFVFAPDTFGALQSAPPGLRAALLAALWTAWMVLTAGNSQMPNTSSLHSFYRARLNRAYLAVGNRQRSLDRETGERADVTRVVEGDDASLRAYRPETEGGPIHLVNACLNQTRDDKSGLYNADRKGTSVTATWRGFEVGPCSFIAWKPQMDVGTLGRWVAVSGAAASPGAGAYTSRGLALLVYFLGVRLGHWMRAPVDDPTLGWLRRLGWRVLPKPLMLTAEASATFYGSRRPWWYLSDGGHFENSGVYPLLKREVGFIILSDAGCDADYLFGDIENLVRKARIDFGCEIDFYTRAEAAGLFTLGSPDLTVLSPEELADNHSRRGVLLARIRYRERAGPARADGSAGPPVRPEGTLLVIKPNLHDALDVDLLAYAQKNETFPHESTGDQSFDEAQWESYHRLGEDFGRALHESWLAQLPGWNAPARHALRVAARVGVPGPTVTVAATEPLWRRGVRATALGATLGLGASGTLLLSLWQVQEQMARNRTEEQAQVRQLFTDVSKGLQALEGACPQLPEHLVTQASLLLDLSGSPSLRPLEQAGVDRLVERMAEACDERARPDAACQREHLRMQASLCAPVRQKTAGGNRVDTALSYWHPGTAPAVQAAQSRKLVQQVAARFPVFGTRSGTPATDLARADVTAARGRDDPFSVPGGSAAPSAAPANSPVAAAPTPGSGAESAGASGTESAAPVSPSSTPSLAPSRPAPIVRPGDSESASKKEAAISGTASARALQVCRSGDGPRTLYLQIYDEASRLPVAELRQSLQQAAGAALVVAPAENATRTAELRQQRRPVPWPKPTLVMHQGSSRACARAIGALIGAPWLLPDDTDHSDRIWLRELPPSLTGRPGVIELWLPPLALQLSQNTMTGSHAGGPGIPSR